MLVAKGKEKQLWQASKRVEKEENIRNGGHSSMACDVAVNKIEKKKPIILCWLIFYLNYVFLNKL